MAERDSRSERTESGTRKRTGQIQGGDHVAMVTSSSVTFDIC